ncbi:MAG: hypothetical protein ACFCVF_06420 [Kineosporiaceae bacterium]
MTYSVLWTTLPAGLSGSDLRIALVASPRIEVTVEQLGESPLQDWPGLVEELGELRLQVNGSPELRPLTRLTGEPSGDLWRRMLDPGTRARRSVPGVRQLRTTPKESFVQAAEGIGEIFGGPDPTERVAQVVRALALAPQDERITAALPASARARGSVPLDRLTGRELAATAAALRGRGATDLALALPIAAEAGALRTAPADQAVPAPLDGIERIDQAEFHQLVGLLLDHPVLAVQAGLRLDFAVPAAGLDGEHLIRVVRADGTPLDGVVPRPQPWSRVRLTGTPRRRFTMADGGEVRDGLLDLSPDPGSDFVVTTLDVTGLSTHLTSMAGDPGAGEARPPVRRNAGLTVARRFRPTDVIQAALARASALSAGVGGVDGAPVLTAADVTVGYRLDVARDGGPLRSLMRRRVAYRVGTGPAAVSLTEPAPGLPDTGEGRVQHAVGMQQPDADGQPLLRIGEEIAQWDGWAMSAPRPGRTVTAEPGSEEATADLGAEPIPGVPVTADVTPETGSVTPLRYGSDYVLRGRAVFLGGVSLPPDLDDDSRLSAPTSYLRTESFPPPVLVHRRRNTEGESLTRVVVRSDGFGTPLGAPAERHLAAPKSSIQQAEWHGAFDAAFGPDSPARTAARAALLTVARREAGSFLDPTVLGPDGEVIPQPGIAVVTNDPAAQPQVVLPPRRGDTLPNGAYVVHDSGATRLPYLPEVLVTGAVVAGLDSDGPTALAYGGVWPERHPGRLVVHPTTAPVPSTRVTTEAGRAVFHIDLPPGAETAVQLSSTLDPDRLGDLDLGADGDPATVAAGLDPRLSATETVTLVHATRKPAADPVLVAATATVDRGALGATVEATVQAHRDTTGRIDLEATWDETVDTGDGPVRATRRTAVAGSVRVDRGSGAVALEIEHHLGETGHRTVTYTPVASTRFAEYFAGRASGAAGQRRGPGVTLEIENRAVPPQPVLHSVVPTYSTSRVVDGSAIILRRRGAGVRVFLARKWNVTGDGEQLGVVAFPNDAAGNAVLAAGEGRLDLVSRIGSDPLQEQVPKAVAHLTDIRFGRRDLATTRQLPLLEPTAGGQALSIVGHPVRFDGARGLWFADVDVTFDDTLWPFVQLGLVRYQPTSIGGCHVSKVVKTDFAQLPAGRKLTFSRHGQFGVTVTVAGEPLANGSFSLRQERRIHDPNASGIDVFSDAGVGTADGWSITPAPTLPEGALARITLDRTAPLDANDPLVTQLFNGRIVVEERQTGMAIAGPGTDSRVVYAETLDRRSLGIGSIPAQP